MTLENVSQAKNPDVRASLVALKRAAELARKVAIATDTEIVVVAGGKIVQVSAAQLRKDAA